METVSQTKTKFYSVQVPSKDAAMFRSFVTRMGWTSKVQKPKRTQLDCAFDEVRQGKLYNAEDAADVIRQCLG